MSMGDLTQEVFTEEDTVERILIEPRPVVFVDTCCLGDIFRGVLDGKVNGTRQAFLAFRNNIEKHYCYYLFSEQVKEELCKPDQFVKREIDALNQPIKRWNAAVQTCGDLRADIFSGIEECSKFDLEAANAFYEGVLGRVATIFSMGIVVKPSEKSMLWGSRREGCCKRPAQQGKSSYGDCIICGSAINIMHALRDEGFAGAAHFVSSNVRDYAKGNLLHPDLTEEFDGCGLTYCRSILQTYGSIVGGTGHRGAVDR